MLFINNKDELFVIRKKKFIDKFSIGGELEQRDWTVWQKVIFSLAETSPRDLANDL